MRRVWRAIVLLAVFFLSFILQTTILPQLRFQDVIPDLLLILIIFTGLSFGFRVGGAVGFAAGLLQDMISCRYLGLGALSGFLTGYGAGYLEDKVYKENPFVPLLVTFLGTFVFNLIYVFGMAVSGAGIFSFSVLWRYLLLEAIYNTIIGMFIYRPFLRIAPPKEFSAGFQDYGRFYR